MPSRQGYWEHPHPSNASPAQPPPGTGSWLLIALWKGSQIPLHEPNCIPGKLERVQKCTKVLFSRFGS